MLARVEQATKNAEMARRTHDLANDYVDGKPHLKTLLSEQGGKLGQIARMGGKLIHFYQEDLTNMLLEDILTETAMDMQQIAEKERDKQVVDKTKQMAENLLSTLFDFQNEAAAIEKRWMAAPKASTVELGAVGDTLPIDELPKPIKLEGGYLNPFDASLSLNAQMILEDNAVKEEEPKDAFEMIGGPSTEVYQPQRKYKLGLSKQQIDKIAGYKQRYAKYLESHNQTSHRDVWKIYDHIAAELLKEQVDSVLEHVVSQDIEKWLLEQVIIDEFQV